MNEKAASTMRRDLISAYFASFSRIASWVVVSSFVFRYCGREDFAILAFVRATLGVLTYASIGLAPAMIRMIAVAKTKKTLDPPSKPASDEIRSIYGSAILLATMSVGLSLLIVLAYLRFAMTGSLTLGLDANKHVTFVLLIGMGLAIRLASDIAGVALQTHGKIALDNVLLAVSEIAWVIFVYMLAGYSMTIARNLDAIGMAFFLASVLLIFLRVFFASKSIHISGITQASWPVAKKLLSIGLLVVIAQMADYLYAPTDYILIRLFVDPPSVIADYSPAIQIDAGLLILVTGIASVLLPKSAIEHAAGNIDRVRSYYVRGTLLSSLILIIAAGVVLIFQDKLFRLWFHSQMTGTQAILPLVLVHTIVGGSSAVGRSILLATGKVKPFTISVLIAGVTNVVLSFVFVKYFNLGLKGIVLGTIIAVVGRCAIWMPWYVMRTLKNSSQSQIDLDAVTPISPA